MLILYVRGVKGAVLISIIASTVLAVIVQAFTHLERISDTNPHRTRPELKGSLIAVPVFDTLGRWIFGGRQNCLRHPAGLLSLMLAGFFDDGHHGGRRRRGQPAR